MGGNDRAGTRDQARGRGFVDKLVLAATRPPAPAYTAPGADMRQPILGQPPRNMTMPEFFATTWAQTSGDGFATNHPAMMAQIANQITQRITPRSGVLNQARAIVAWHGVDRISHLNTATTVIHGAQDPLIPVENGRRLAKLIPGAAYAQLAGVGHLVAHEAGDARDRGRDRRDSVELGRLGAGALELPEVRVGRRTSPRRPTACRLARRAGSSRAQDRRSPPLTWMVGVPTSSPTGSMPSWWLLRRASSYLSLVAASASSAGSPTSSSDSL